jgi:hypothetical protein
MRPRTRHDRLPERMWVTPAIGGLLVAALLATTLVLPTVSDRSVILALTVVVAVALLGALTLAWPSTNTRGPLNTAGQLVLHLTPVLLLTTVFPLVDSDTVTVRGRALRGAGAARPGLAAAGARRLPRASAVTTNLAGEVDAEAWPNW